MVVRSTIVVVEKVYHGVWKVSMVLGKSTMVLGRPKQKFILCCRYFLKAKTKNSKHKKLDGFWGTNRRFWGH